MIGIHGIAKQQLGRHQLRQLWRPALADGLERAAGHPVGLPPLDIAFYGDVFLPSPTAGTKAGTDADEVLLDDLTDDELADLTAAVPEAVSEQELAAAEADTSKGYTRVPLPLQAAMRALDKRFGPAAGVLYLGELRQVRRYLCSAEVKSTVDARVAAAIGADCRILVAHSLGSVVALEYLRQHPEHHVDLLLTMGSPLGLRMVCTRLPDPAFGTAPGGPGNVGTWVNLRDPRDPVACAGDLSRWWPVVRPAPVDNQGDAHAADRYLSKKEAGQAALAAAPWLAS